MNTSDSGPKPALRLQCLLKSADLRSSQLDANRRMVNVVCRTREVALVVGLTTVPNIVSGADVLESLERAMGQGATS